MRTCKQSVSLGTDTCCVAMETMSRVPLAASSVRVWDVESAVKRLSVTENIIVEWGKRCRSWGGGHVVTGDASLRQSTQRGYRPLEAMCADTDNKPFEKITRHNYRQHQLWHHQSDYWSRRRMSLEKAYHGSRSRPDGTRWQSSQCLLQSLLPPLKMNITTSHIGLITHSFFQQQKIEKNVKNVFIISALYRHTITRRTRVYLEHTVTCVGLQRRTSTLVKCHCIWHRPSACCVLFLTRS